MLKAFNTTTAVNLTSGPLVDGTAAQALVAGDDDDAKQTLRDCLAPSLLEIVDVGDLNRARELESIGLIELSLAAQKRLPLTGGSRLVH